MADNIDVIESDNAGAFCSESTQCGHSVVEDRRNFEGPLPHFLQGFASSLERPARTVCEAYIDGHCDFGLDIRVGVEPHDERWLARFGMPIAVNCDTADEASARVFSGLKSDLLGGNNSSCGNQIDVFVASVEVVDFKKKPISVLVPVWFERADRISVGLGKSAYLFLDSGVVKELTSLSERKIRLARTISGSFRQPARKVVQRRSDIVQSLSSEDADSFRRTRAFEEVISDTGFNIVVDKNTVRVSVLPFEKAGAKVVDLFLGPVEPRRNFYHHSLSG